MAIKKASFKLSTLRFFRLFGNSETALSFRRRLSNQILRHPPRMLLISFALMIAAGTVLLSLPQATQSGEPLAFLDALFTATSATCVTGLIVVDTGTTFSLFGQLVILCLIQIGGLGIMTLSTFFVFIISGRLGFSAREMLIDTLSQNPAVELTRLLKLVFLFTIVIEAVGWLFLTFRFLAVFPLTTAAYHGLFHAVSAFCNAGFSLYPDSFMAYQNDPVINLILIVLIVLGGLGFLVIFDLYNKRSQILKLNFKVTSLHTRVVLGSTAILLLAGTLLFAILEYSNTLQNLPVQGKIFASLFHSVTARTAGFNTLPVDTLANSTLFVLALFMFIGASPGSCGGGVKTTTMTLVILSIFNRFKMREHVNIFYRRIPDATVSRMISIIFFSITAIIVFTVLLSISEIPQLPHTRTRGQFLEILFEVISAFGTVGLSTGVTSALTSVGKILITILMFIGRLGPLTVALAIGGRSTEPSFKYLQQDVMVG